MATKLVVLPEPFNRETSWEDWRLHFEDVAAVMNGQLPEVELALCLIYGPSTEGVSQIATGIPSLICSSNKCPEGTIPAKVQEDPQPSRVRNSPQETHGRLGKVVSMLLKIYDPWLTGAFQTYKQMVMNVLPYKPTCIFKTSLQ